MNNYNYFNDDWYKNLPQQNYSFRNINSNMNTFNPTLVNPTEGYIRGNLFANLYDQYKNYKPDQLQPSNEKERLFLELAKTSFAEHELNLYLDLNPNDMTMLKLFNDYREKCKMLTDEYESKYGPLTTSSDVLNKSPFMWDKNPWPWEDRYNV